MTVERDLFSDFAPLLVILVVWISIWVFRDYLRARKERQDALTRAFTRHQHSVRDDP